MIKALYRCLLLLHPAPFRRRFADEMLCIFDEARQTLGAGTLLRDVSLSLARQWLLRSALWRIPAAIAGAMLTLMATLAIVPSSVTPHAAAVASPRYFVVLAGAISVIAIACTLLLCVYWFRFSIRRRA